MNNYFFDSSAIIEIINNDTLQEKFIPCRIITNALHLAEVYYYFLKNHNRQTADYWVKSLTFEIIDMSTDLSLKGALFRFENQNKRFSYADCIGYATAVHSNLIFLTCDKDFANLDNVEFVK